MRIVNLIQKKPVTANCDQGSGVCTVTIQNFPIPIAAPCQAGDCVSPTNAILQAGARLRRAAARLLLAQCSCPQACSPHARVWATGVLSALRAEVFGKWARLSARAACQRGGDPMRAA